MISDRSRFRYLWNLIEVALDYAHKMQEDEILGDDVISYLLEAQSDIEYTLDNMEEVMFTDEMKEDIKGFCAHYGADHQIKRAQTEIFELSDAIMDYEKAKKSTLTQDFGALADHVAEEFGDVMIMLYQIILSYGISDDQIQEHMKRKIERQKERIKNGEAETI